MSTTNALNINTGDLPIFDATAGQFDSVSLTAKGDLLVHDGTDYTNMVVGADGLALSANSGEATGLEWTSIPFIGDFVLISTADVSNAATVSFTDLDTSTYSSFFFYLVQVHPQTDNVFLRCLFSVNNGSTYLSSGYRWVYRTLDASTGTDSENHDSSDSDIELADRIGNAGTEGIGGYVWYFPSNSPSQMRQSLITELYGLDTSSTLNGYWGSGTSSTTSVVNAIRFQFSSGNVESGKFYLYGYEAS